jgi:single-stranded-DNA-specific exonuclease
MNKRWKIKTHDHNSARRLAAELGIMPVTAALLIDRGFESPQSARDFLFPENGRLHDPFLLQDLEKAVRRILQAINNKEKILIWGDYDVDGTTGTVLLRRVFKKLSAQTFFHIPNRFSEGYGLNRKALADYKSAGVSLVITVDCGTKNKEEIKWASENGLDVIVTDHHLAEASDGLPPAVAVVNPNRWDCGYPDKNLAGVGVAFKLAEALAKSTGLSDLINDLFEVAALGTVADIMNLRGENRTIVSRGLSDLKKTNSKALKALMEVSGCNDSMTSEDIAFRLAPRINAAGRMDKGSLVVDFFEAESDEEALLLAAELNKLNSERQRVQNEVIDSALRQIGEAPEKKFIVVGSEGWHRGVIGLAASKIVEKFNRPTIVFSYEGEIAHASARSIPGFHILDAIRTCEDILIQYGGHSAAAGLKANTIIIDQLSERLDSFARKAISDEELIPELVIDARLQPSTISLELFDELKLLEPFGAGNPRPVFVTGGFEISFQPQVIKEKHLKLFLRDQTGRVHQAIWWNAPKRYLEQTPKTGARIEAAYHLDVNIWKENKHLQLVIRDIRADN